MTKIKFIWTNYKIIIQKLSRSVINLLIVSRNSTLCSVLKQSTRSIPTRKEADEWEQCRPEMIMINWLITAVQSFSEPIDYFSIQLTVNLRWMIYIRKWFMNKCAVLIHAEEVSDLWMCFQVLNYFQSHVWTDRVIVHRHGHMGGTKFIR